LVRNWRIPWVLVERIKDIQEIMPHMVVTIKHIFREANQLADYITNVAINKVGKQHFQNFNQLTSMGRRILNIDKQQIPSIKVKTRKIYINNND